MNVATTSLKESASARTVGSPMILVVDLVEEEVGMTGIVAATAAIAEAMVVGIVVAMVVIVEAMADMTTVEEAGEDMGETATRELVVKCMKIGVLDKIACVTCCPMILYELPRFGQLQWGRSPSALIKRTNDFYVCKGNLKNQDKTLTRCN
mmetsp:Transcript_28571/g.34697  ORF Transcript_28571/g.34697 Transcript_28571/m.34697 type:complete len:151 (+) Transcript_28571:734-1186(+)